MSQTYTQNAAPDRARGLCRFARHYLEMVPAMFVGMLVLGAATRGVLALAGVEFSAARHPEAAALEMAFDMSVGMVVWMCLRGHGLASALEMCGAMFAPVLVLFPLLWLDVIGAESMIALEHVAMFPLMLLVMLRRRRSYTGWASPRTTTRTGVPS
ncbi:MAG: hypothetical protein ACRDOO_26045 [Actinomadura sp.]